MSGYALLTRADTRAFEDESWEIIDAAQQHGWKFRVSSKGHAIGRAPDGKTTLSVSPQNKGTSTRRNQRAPWERWLRQHQAVADGAQRALDAFATGLSQGAMLERLDEIVDAMTANGVLGEGNRETFKSLVKMTIEDDAVAQVLGLWMMSPRTNPAPELWLRDLDHDEANILTADSRLWRVQWVMYTDVEGHVTPVGWGGPQMRKADAEQWALGLMAARARRKAEKKQAAIDAATPTTATMETTVKMHVCTECDKHFENPSRLKGHMTSTHTMVECEFCGRVTKGPGPAGVHRKRCEQNPDRVLTDKEKIAAAVEKGVQARLAAAPPPEAPIAPLAPAGDGQAALDALMTVLADYDRLRMTDVDSLHAQIATLTTERDQAVKELGVANERLANLRAALG